MARKAAAEQKRQDALIARAGSRGSGAAAAGLISVPNAAALALVPAAGRAEGTIAYVVTYGSYFALSPTAPPSPDVVITASDGRSWTRDLTARAAVFTTQAAWFVDPVAGNNEATGKTIGAPLKDKTEIMRRWGTWSPTIDGIDVVVTCLTSETDGSDPGLFRPILTSGATFLLTAPLPAATFTGTLLALTAKNRAANVILSSTFTPATGAVAPNMLLINHTRGESLAFAQRDLGGGNWRLTQPWSASASPRNTGAPIDTWANGDSVSGFVLVSVNLGNLGAPVVDFSLTGDFSTTVSQVKLFDPGGPHAEDTFTLNADAFPLITNCVVERCLQIDGNGPFGRVSNCMLVGDFPVQSQTPFIIQGGAIAGVGTVGNVQLENAFLQFDVLMLQPNAELLDSGCEAMALDYVGGFTIFDGRTNSQSIPSSVYGTGGVNCRSGAYLFSGPATGALPCSGGLRLNGVATGYSNVTAAGVTTVHGGIALTAANLVAAAGAAGFGGYAYGGGAAFVQSGVQP